jgi:CBS-domain-containing membrane protein
MLAHSLREQPGVKRQRLYPIVDDRQRLAGVVTRADLQRLVDASPADARAHLEAITHTAPVVAYPDESLRLVVYRMAETGLTRLPVVSRAGSKELIGMIGLTDLLKARGMNLDAEQRRERVLRVNIARPFGRRPEASASAADAPPR